MAPPIHLVIFDCDGVLVDTEPVSNAVLQRQLEAIGMPMSLDEVIGTFIGRSKGDCLAMIAERRGAPLPAGFEPEWDRAFDAALRDETRAIEGVAELLRDLQLPYCVASNGEPDRMRVALEAAGLLALVEGRLFTASDWAGRSPRPTSSCMRHAPWARILPRPSWWRTRRRVCAPPWRRRCGCSAMRARATRSPRCSSAKAPWCSARWPS